MTIPVETIPVEKAVAVRLPHRRSYDDPIRVSQGDTIAVTRRVDEWDGHLWVWAVAADGREGWVPGDLAGTAEGPSQARYDYNAVELNVVAGETVTLLHKSHGWVWCRTEDGRQGWIPEKNLDQEETAVA